MILLWRYSKHVVVTGEGGEFVIHKSDDDWGMTGTDQIAPDDNIDAVFADLNRRWRDRSWPFEDIPKESP
jgi:hypothetical protein